ncbi:hypothetical protein CsSME_00029578 [Camellia sinensis var. sinensis]
MGHIAHTNELISLSRVEKCKHQIGGGPNPLSSKKKKNCGHAKANLVSEKSRCRTAMMAVKPQEPGAGNGKDYVSKAKSLK